MINVIIIAVVAVIIGAAMRYIIKSKKQGKCIGCSACSGNCGSCGDCK